MSTSQIKTNSLELSAVQNEVDWKSGRRNQCGSVQSLAISNRGARRNSIICLSLKKYVKS